MGMIGALVKLLSSDGGFRFDSWCPLREMYRERGIIF
jgi:hypothetical protein